MSVNPWRETGENTGWYMGEFKKQYKNLRNKCIYPQRKTHQTKRNLLLNKTRKVFITAPFLGPSDSL